MSSTSPHTPHISTSRSQRPPQANPRPIPTEKKVCCGEKGSGEGSSVVDETAATLKSMYTGDASIGVSLLSSGTGERLGGTWYLSLDGEASEPINAGANAEEVLAAIQNLTAAGNVSVSGNAEGEGYNGERSWVMKFFDWNDPNRTAVPPVVFIGSEDLVGIGAAAHLEAAAGASITTDVDGELQISQLCAKEVLNIASLISSGEIECVVVAAWQGGTSYAVPAFSFDADAASVEAALAGVNGTALGEVWVSRQEGPSTSGGGVWDLTFVGNSEGRMPGLQCASDADVSQVTSSTCEPIGGSFGLAFEGSVAQDIAFDASEQQVRACGTEHPIKACPHYRLGERSMNTGTTRYSFLSSCSCIFTEAVRLSYLFDV